jgi:simple sugar transport system permease protein
MEWLDYIAQITASSLRLAVPLIFASLAGLYSERSGVFDISLEGKMLVSAFAAGTVAAFTGSAWLALGVAVLASVAFALIHGLACITYRGNQIVSGVAINMIAAGLTAQLGQTWFERGGQTPQLSHEARFMDIIWPNIGLGRIPVLGQIYEKIISGQSLLAYIALLSVPLTAWVLYHTRFGLRLRAVGENPAAVDTAGISVTWLRYRAVICCGILTGFSGAYLSISQTSGFIPNMSAGKGFIALAALVFAKWQPYRAFFACLLFGFLEAVAIRLQGQSIFGFAPLPVQLMQAIPYILTVILLAGFIGKAAAPKAGGIAYVKEQ